MATVRIQNNVPWSGITGGLGSKTNFSSGGGNKNTSTSTTNTTNNSNTNGSSTQRDTGTVTQNTLVPEWAQQGNQQQYNNAVANNATATDFYSSVLGGTNTAADLWSQRMMREYLQQATSAPGFTETGAAAQGIASGEALAAVEAAMFGRMNDAARDIQTVGQNTVPFLSLAGEWAPRQEVRDLTSTKNWTENTVGSGASTTKNTDNTGGGGLRSTRRMIGDTQGGTTSNRYIGPMFNYGTGLGALPGNMASRPTSTHPAYAAFLAGNNPAGYQELQRQRLIR